MGIWKVVARGKAAKKKAAKKRRRRRRTRVEQTMVLIKPDAVARGLVGNIIARLSRAGTIVYMRLLRLTREAAEEFLPNDEQWKRKLGQRAIDRFAKRGTDPVLVFKTDDPIKIAEAVRERLIGFYMMAPVVGIVIEGHRARSIVRKICGQTSPTKAEPGTLRESYSRDDFDVANIESRPCLNLVHSSSRASEARREIAWLLAQSEPPEKLVLAGISPILVGYIRKLLGQGRLV